MLPRLLLVLSLIVPAALHNDTSAAVTCSGGLPQDMRERFELLAGYAEAIVIAEITGSAVVTPGLQGPIVVPPDTEVATFKPVALLAQEEPLTEFTIGPLRPMGPDCSGGPRLRSGDRVLLFLTREDQYRVAYWRVGVFGDVVIFRGADAVYAPAFENHYEPAGSTRRVIETILDVVQPPAEARAAALAFLREQSSGTQPPAVPRITPPDTGSAGLR